MYPPMTDEQREEFEKMPLDALVNMAYDGQRMMAFFDGMKVLANEFCYQHKEPLDPDSELIELRMSTSHFVAIMTMLEAVRELEAKAVGRTAEEITKAHSGT